MDRSSECISQGQEQRKPPEVIQDLELATEMTKNPGSPSWTEPVRQERLAPDSLQTGSVHRLPTVVLPSIHHRALTRARLWGQTYLFSLMKQLATGVLE